MTARFVPLSVTGVSVNIIMAMLVAYVVGFAFNYIWEPASKAEHRTTFIQPGQIILLVGICASALSALLMAINDPSKTCKPFCSYSAFERPLTVPAKQYHRLVLPIRIYLFYHLGSRRNHARRYTLRVQDRRT